MSTIDLSEIEKLHAEAMKLAEEADALRAQGSHEAARELLIKAFDQESSAAKMFSEIQGDEPTRSVLLRSAASLGIECGQWREAERLVAEGLAGNPPAEIADELRDLFQEIYAALPKSR